MVYPFSGVEYRWLSWQQSGYDVGVQRAVKHDVVNSLITAMAVDTFCFMWFPDVMHILCSAVHDVS